MESILSSVAATSSDADTKIDLQTEQRFARFINISGVNKPVFF